MTYDKTNWVDGETPLSATNMNNLETQYDKTIAELNTHKAETASYEISGHIKIDDDTIKVVNGIAGVPTGKFQPTEKITGYAEYTDSVPALQTITKEIEIGVGKTTGFMVIARADLGYRSYGILVKFSTNKLEALAAGIRGSSTYGGAAARRAAGFISGTGTYDLGHYILGSSSLRVNNVWIDGTKIKIEVYNTSDTTHNMNTRIDWEVW